MHRAAYQRFASSIAAVVSIAALSIGCSSVDPNGTPLDGNQGAPDGGVSPSDNGGAHCDPGPPPAPMDPASLPACCATGQKGAAHCVPSDKVPSGIASNLATCSGGSCVPDPFIVNPSKKPAACKSIGGADGVCLSVCVPQVAQYVSLLPQDSCGADEKCAPCISPLDHKSTGACDIGKNGSGGTCAPPSGGGGGGGGGGDAGQPAPAQCPHQGAPVLDPSTLPACGAASSGAHCLDKTLVPAAMASQLAACPTGLCVPDDFIAAGGNFIPSSCRSLNDAEGRCLNENIPQVASQLSQLPTSTCKAFERCVPCFNPLDSKDTGSCRLSCDPGPKEAAKPFKQCCTPEHATTPQGRCVPKTQIPAAEQKNLNQDECTANEQLCVPSEMLPATFTPTTCSGSTLLTGAYTGVCLSTCLHFGFIQQLGIAQGSCDDVHECAPCKNPLTGQATGAPGCPP